MSKNININSKVKYIYPDYFSAMKDNYFQPVKWCSPSESDEVFMIAGEYNVKSVKRKLFFWEEYELSNINEFINGAFLQLSEFVQSCPYKVCEYVIFNPKCSIKESEYITMISKIHSRRHYKIKEIINDYYILIDSTCLNNRDDLNDLPQETKQLIRKYPNMVKNYCQNILIPYRWIDFKSIS
jgi:hypothetical protein